MVDQEGLVLERGVGDEAVVGYLMARYFKRGEGCKRETRHFEEVKGVERFVYM